MLQHINATINDRVANAAYWAGIYAMRRATWIEDARHDKRNGWDITTAVRAARDYNHHLLRQLAILKDAGVLTPRT